MAGSLAAWGLATGMNGMPNTTVRSGAMGGMGTDTAGITGAMLGMMTDTQMWLWRRPNGLVRAKH